MFKEQLELVPADEGHGPVICHATGEDQGADKGAPPGSRWAAAQPLDAFIAASYNGSPPGPVKDSVAC